MIDRQGRESRGNLAALQFSSRLSAADRARICLDNGMVWETDRLIVGGGWAAKMAYASLPHIDDSIVILAGAKDPWARRTGFFGQTSDCLPLRFAECSPDTTYWIECSKFHKHIESLSAAAEKATIQATVQAVRRSQETSDKRRMPSFELAVEYNGSMTCLLADRVDICTGPGPLRKLSPSNDDRRLLESNGRIVYGDSFYLVQDMRGEEIAVYGGGSTAAWAVEHAIRAGASRVDWFARPILGAPSSPNEVDISAQRITTARYFRSMSRDLRESILTDFRSVLPGFAMAVTPRNIDPTTSEAFSSPRVHFYHSDLDIAAFQRLSDSRLRVATHQGYSSDFDRAFICIGNDDIALGSVARMVSSQVKLRAIWKDHRALGIESEDGRLRVLGSAAAQPALIQRLGESDRLRYLNDLKYRVATSGGSGISSPIAVSVWYNAIFQANAS